MNRYMAQGIVEDILDGKRVLVLTHSRDDIADSMNDVLAVRPRFTPDAFVVRRTHGNEHIRTVLSSGRADFHSTKSQLRGISADVVVFTDDPRYDHDEDWFLQFHHTVAAKAEVIMP